MLSITCLGLSDPLDDLPLPIRFAAPSRFTLAEPLAEFPTPRVSKNNQYILETIIVYVVV